MLLYESVFVTLQGFSKATTPPSGETPSLAPALILPHIVFVLIVQTPGMQDDTILSPIW